VLIWSPRVPRRLIGFFPARIESFRYGLPLPVLVGWTHAYAPLGTPLVDRTAAEEVISAWLDHVAGHTRLPKLVLLPYLPADGPLADVLRRALARRAGGMVWFGNHARACLAPPSERASYLATQCMGKNARNCGANASGSPKWGTSSVLLTRCLPTSALPSMTSWHWKPQAGKAGRERRRAAGKKSQTSLPGAVSALARQRKAQIVRLCIDANAVAALGRSDGAAARRRAHLAR
jgi:hypothetical protein